MGLKLTNISLIAIIPLVPFQVPLHHQRPTYSYMVKRNGWAHDAAYTTPVISEDISLLTNTGLQRFHLNVTETKEWHSGANSQM